MKIMREYHFRGADNFEGFRTQAQFIHTENHPKFIFIQYLFQFLELTLANSILFTFMFPYAHT